MKKISEMHTKAMEFADQAMLARMSGRASQARELISKAFEQEMAAADKIAPDLAAEPTRSVLHRSAASLALQIGKNREGERLIAVGLSGNPPDEIADELRDLLETV